MHVWRSISWSHASNRRDQTQSLRFRSNCGYRKHARTRRIASWRCFDCNERKDNRGQQHDAEGRLVLADALTYACKNGADELIDVATLTGAVVTALGRAAAESWGTIKD